jgi:hypothetical protein
LSWSQLDRPAIRFGSPPENQGNACSPSDLLISEHCDLQVVSFTPVCENQTRAGAEESLVSDYTAVISPLTDDREGGRPTSHRRELEALEAALLRARGYAESIDDPTLTYFIDMAIHEVKAKAPGKQRGARPSGTPNVVQLTS